MAVYRTLTFSASTSFHQTVWYVSPPRVSALHWALVKKKIKIFNSFLSFGRRNPVTRNHSRSFSPWKSRCTVRAVQRNHWKGSCTCASATATDTGSASLYFLHIFSPVRSIFHFRSCVYVYLMKKKKLYFNSKFLHVHCTQLIQHAFSTPRYTTKNQEQGYQEKFNINTRV